MCTSARALVRLRYEPAIAGGQCTHMHAITHARTHARTHVRPRAFTLDPFQNAGWHARVHSKTHAHTHTERERERAREGRARTQTHAHTWHSGHPHRQCDGVVHRRDFCLFALSPHFPTATSHFLHPHPHRVERGASPPLSMFLSLSLGEGGGMR
jgi:hypothetical protein